MFQIMGDEVQVSQVPCSANIERLKRHRGKIRRLSILGGEEELLEWSEHAKLLEELGIRSLEIQFLAEEKGGYSFLSKFSFVEELILRSDLPLEVEVMKGFGVLHTLAIGIGEKRSYTDMGKYTEFMTEVKSLTLTGKFTNVSSCLERCHQLVSLALDRFALPQNEVLHIPAVRSLYMGECPQFDLSSIDDLGQLEELIVHGSLSLNQLPSLAQSSKLKKFELMASREIYRQESEIRNQLPSNTELILL